MPEFFPYWVVVTHLSIFFYGTIAIHLATNPQTILALEMNRRADQQFYANAAGI